MKQISGSDTESPIVYLIDGIYMMLDFYPSPTGFFCRSN